MAASDFDAGVERCIASEFNMISASDDSQEAQEAYSTKEFDKLPNPNGKEGGACTSAFLQVCYDNAYKMGKLTWVQVLQQMSAQLKDMGLVQEPQLTSSRRLDVNKPMLIVPPKSGRRRALLIGINYVGQEGELKAPHNDTRNLHDYLVNVCGFDPKQMLVLMDDGQHAAPTRQNILDGFERLVKYSQSGDVVFVSFSGHGGQIADVSGDEEDGYDESLIPVDFATAGQIIDDDVLKLLIKPMPQGVYCTMLMDCCHSGTVADLPYKFGADDSEFQTEPNFNMDTADELLAKDAVKNAPPPPKPIKDYHPEPLPYKPEDGFVVRPKKKVNSSDNDEFDPNNNNNNNNKKQRNNNTKKDNPPAPPPQCCSIL